MYELDHMLDGQGSRSHLDELAQQAKLEKLAQEAQDTHDHDEHKASTAQRSVFSSVVLLLTRWA